jgi:hypothetical protein
MPGCHTVIACMYCTVHDSMHCTVHRWVLRRVGGWARLVTALLDLQVVHEPVNLTSTTTTWLLSRLA